jgi:2-polyprenyl-3-methyl-5-hydroxy-6-metoxy-1,4-benzoquinol methylase
MADVSAHYDGSAPSYHEQYDPDLIWENAEYPANFFRLQKVINTLRERGVASVYDLGAGEASPIIAIRENLDVDIRASDLSPEMVRLGKENLIKHEMDPAWLNLVDIRDARAVREEAARVGQFDAVIALGVIPHVEDDDWFVEAMSLFLKPGGTLILQFRNAMFSMFTFNRLTKEFILEELMTPVPEDFRAVVESDLDQRLAVDKPPKRTWDKDAPAYDEILARFHNPFELAEIVKARGFGDLSYQWYNFHPTYPMVAGSFDPKDYRQAQINLEADDSWRGMFLCSAGMIIARKLP